MSSQDTLITALAVAGRDEYDPETLSPYQYHAGCRRSLSEPSVDLTASRRY